MNNISLKFDCPILDSDRGARMKVHPESNEQTPSNRNCDLSEIVRTHAPNPFPLIHHPKDTIYEEPFDYSQPCSNRQLPQIPCILMKFPSIPKTYTKLPDLTSPKGFSPMTYTTSSSYNSSHEFSCNSTNPSLLIISTMGKTCL